jgi:glycosyltransferase involved in cell wall biosynthesis
MQHITTTPKVSVVIPIYNMELYLEETILSVLASSYADYEVLLIDDGSSDNSVSIAKRFANQYEHISFYEQPNQGVSAARNNAIKWSKGSYILPVDADNLIGKEYILAAVNVLETHPNVKVVTCEAEFIGEKQGKWKQLPFSVPLLARKNMIDNCAMYRKSDWEQCGGYCEAILGREDWDFWISMLKNGGDVVRLPIVGLYYRVRSNSKRRKTQHRKKKLIDLLNVRHADFFEKQLHGRLHYNRTYSKLFNWIEKLIGRRKTVIHPNYSQLAPFIEQLPFIFLVNDTIVHKGRNTLKQFSEKGLDLVVKSYQIPHIINRLSYGIFRSSKAKRAYEYALTLQLHKIGTPQPIAYIEQRFAGLLYQSYFASVRSTCPYTFNTLIQQPSYEYRTLVLQEIGRFTANVHTHGMLHQDYSGGNILFDIQNGKVVLELVDLNRIVFKQNIGIEEGCKNFERLNIDEEALRIMATEYATARNFDVDRCVENVLKMRWHKHKQR